MGRSLADDLPSPSDGDIDRLLAVARRGALKKALLGQLRDAVASFVGDVRGGLEQTHRWFSREISEDAGQHALELLGSQERFRWESDSAPETMFSARGSDVIERLYGDHVDRLTEIVQRAADRRRPMPAGELRKMIREEWDGLRKHQVERIARTETAAIWELSNLYTLLSNGVDQFDWIVATGPSVGPPTTERVCTRCLRASIGSPYAAADVPIPPRHPNCRCTLVPATNARWAVPDQVWAGSGRIVVGLSGGTDGA